MRRGELEVQAFSEIMLEKLGENHHKPRLEPLWLPHLQDALFGEVRELCEALCNRDRYSNADIGKEAADVANYAMLIALNVGALPWEDE